MAPSQTRIVVYLISAAVFITQHQGQATLLCDNFCIPNNVVTCTCEDTSNPFNKTVWKLSNSTTSNSITLNQTGMCNATSGSFPAFPGIMAVNDAQMMTMCDSSTLSITKSSKLEVLKIYCMSPDGTSYGSTVFSTVNPGPPVVTICRATPSIGFLMVNSSSGGIPSSYNVNITIGSSTIKDSVSALSNGTATYSFPYSGSGIPLASATAINCAGNATSTAPLTFDPCSSCLTVQPGAPNVSICRATPITGFLMVNSSSTGGIPSSYNVTITTIGISTIKDSVSALSNGTATYSFPYCGSGIPLASATAINCAGNATSTAPLTFESCSSCLTASSSIPACVTGSPSNPVGIGVGVGVVILVTSVLVVVVVVIASRQRLCNKRKETDNSKTVVPLEDTENTTNQSCTGGEKK